MDSAVAAGILRKAGFIPVIKKIAAKDNSQVNKVIQAIPAEGLYIALCVAEQKNNLFIGQIRDDTSMITIWKKWEEFGMKDKYPKTTEFIKKYKEMERIYGRGNDINKLKANLEKLFDEESGF